MGSPLRTGLGVGAARRGRATRRRRPERPCLNCGDPTPGNYCRSCGQRKVEVLVSVRTMVADALEDEFVLNRRLPLTLFGLFFRPGHLTVEHVNGRIARYVRPFRLYVASSIVFFLLVSFFSLRVLAQSDLDRAGLVPPVPDSLAVEGIDSALTTIRAALADSATSPATAAGLDRTRRMLEAQRQRAVAGRDSAAAVETAANPGAPPARQRPRTIAESLELGEIDASEVNLGIGVAALDSALVRRARVLGDMTPRQAAERLVGDFVNYIPTMMFVFLPLFALLLKLFYVRQRRFYAEHFVFLLHVHAFVYLIFAVLLIARGVSSPPEWLTLLLLGWVVVYIYLAMKRVYRQGWLKTFVKCWALGSAYFVILGLTVPLALALSFLLL